MKMLGNYTGMQLPARLILISLTLSASAFCVLGQTPTPKGVQENPERDSARRPSADETFELNIDERRFSRENFQAGTAVGTEEDSQGLNLQIGVALAAGRIDVLLRNVRGHVRFRGPLDRLFEMMSTRPRPSTAPSAPR
jgi:hypothetical protein